MKMTVNIPAHNPCEDGCHISPAEQITARTWGVSPDQAHALHASFVDNLRQAIDGQQPSH